TGTHSTAIYREARSLGLDENDLRKKPSELSRGQQAKLSFAKLLLAQNQLLILDEPTNHLDIPTRDRIEMALQNYKGAMLVASHDKYFCRQIGIQSTINLDKE
ncbi:MAG: ATP-binding cassette domain-containing protein, partial [Flavobacteriales bacterium]|nr:ATP-binding cassette domain-containing protein [Flavobacteriales bacterium]